MKVHGCGLQGAFDYPRGTCLQNRDGVAEREIWGLGCRVWSVGRGDSLFVVQILVHGRGCARRAKNGVVIEVQSVGFRVQPFQPPLKPGKPTQGPSWGYSRDRFGRFGAVLGTTCQLLALVFWRIFRN